jgi:hypothetical protein
MRERLIRLVGVAIDQSAQNLEAQQLCFVRH